MKRCLQQVSVWHRRPDQQLSIPGETEHQNYLGSAVCSGPAPVGLRAAQALEFQSPWPLAEKTNQDRQNIIIYYLSDSTSSYIIDCIWVMNGYDMAYMGANTLEP